MSVYLKLTDTREANLRKHQSAPAAAAECPNDVINEHTHTQKVDEQWYIAPCGMTIQGCKNKSAPFPVAGRRKSDWTRVFALYLVLCVYLRTVICVKCFEILVHILGLFCNSIFVGSRLQCNNWLPGTSRLRDNRLSCVEWNVKPSYSCSDTSRSRHPSLQHLLAVRK